MPAELIISFMCDNCNYRDTMLVKTGTTHVPLNSGWRVEYDVKKNKLMLYCAGGNCTPKALLEIK